MNPPSSSTYKELEWQSSGAEGMITLSSGREDILKYYEFLFVEIGENSCLLPQNCCLKDVASLGRGQGETR